MRVQSYPGEIGVERTPLGRIVILQGDQMIYVDRECLKTLVEAIWRVGTDLEPDDLRQKVTA